MGKVGCVFVCVVRGGGVEVLAEEEDVGEEEKEKESHSQRVRKKNSFCMNRDRFKEKECD